MKLTEEDKYEVKDFLNSIGLPENRAVTYGDVTLPDQYSDIRSRSGIDNFRSTLINDEITLEAPFISANMASVSGSRMITAIERNGGLGIPFQGLDLEKRLDILESVRRADCTRIDNPATISPDHTIEEAKEKLNEYGVGSLMVTKKGKLVGVLTKRDWFYESDTSGKKVRDLMTANPVTISHEEADNFKKAKDIVREKKIEKIPIVKNGNELAGLITARGLFYHRHHPRALRDQSGQYLRIGSVGVGKTLTDQHIHEIQEQVKLGISALLIDTARANSVNTRDVIEGVKEKFPELPLIVGNVSTPQGAKFLCELGVDVIKVGVGPGHACRTRKVGVGVPQLTAVAKCSAIADKYNASIIADGGITSAGDVAKALIGGADAIMAGFLFARTHEAAAPTKRKYIDELDTDIAVKAYRGSASFEAQRRRKSEETLDEIRRPEGVEQTVPVIGSVDNVVNNLLDGLRSCMSYTGANSIQELKEKGKFILQTDTGYKEGTKGE